MVVAIEYLAKKLTYIRNRTGRLHLRYKHQVTRLGEFLVLQLAFNKSKTFVEVVVPALALSIR
jgi:hypothetical protein